MKCRLTAGDMFVFDDDSSPGDEKRVHLPHREIFEAAKVGDNLLLNDGRVRVEVTAISASRIETRVIFGGALSARKGINLPDTILAMAALTPKDRADLELAASNRRRLDRLVLRATAGRRRRGAQARARAGRRHGQDRKAVGPRRAAGGPGACRRHHDRARRSRRRTAARSRFRADRSRSPAPRAAPAGR